jgi:hypothetical protein
MSSIIDLYQLNSPSEVQISEMKLHGRIATILRYAFTFDCTHTCALALQPFMDAVCTLREILRGVRAIELHQPVSAIEIARNSTTAVQIINWSAAEVKL